MSIRDDYERNEYLDAMREAAIDDEYGEDEYDYNDGDYEGPYDDYDDRMTDVEADADTLKSAGYGTDEDYGYDYYDAYEDERDFDMGDY